MKILALIKYSLDVAEVKVDPATKELRLAGVPRKIGTIDKHVVEAAVQLKEQTGGSVVAVSFGPPEARESFREVLAMGVDEVVLVEDTLAAPDPATVAQVLAAAVQKFADGEIVVCGETSDDGYSYETGPRLAERLGYPLVSYVTKVQVADGQFTADRDLGSMLQTVSGPLPVVLTVTEETNHPRRTTLMDALKAKKKPVHVWQIEADLGLMVDDLQQAVRWELVGTEGIVVQRKQQVFKGADMAALADQVIDALIAENLLKEGA